MAGSAGAYAAFETTDQQGLNKGVLQQEHCQFGVIATAMAHFCPSEFRAFSSLLVPSPWFPPIPKGMGAAERSQRRNTHPQTLQMTPSHGPFFLEYSTWDFQDYLGLGERGAQSLY